MKASPNLQMRKVVIPSLLIPTLNIYQAPTMVRHYSDPGERLIMYETTTAHIVLII